MATLASGLIREIPALEERELMVLLFAVTALAFLIFRRRQLLDAPSSGLQLGALGALVAGLVITNVEAFVAGSTTGAALNVAEHVAYVLHTVLLAAYVLREMGRVRR